MCFPVPILNFSSLAVVNGHAKEFTGTFRLEALLYLVEAQVWQKCSWLLKCRYKNLATNFLQVALKKDVCCLLWYACMNSYEPYLSQYSPPHTHTQISIKELYYITVSHEQPIPSLPSSVTNWTNQVLDIGIQDQLHAHLSTMKPRPSIYSPDFIAANQEDRADNVLSGKGVVTPLKYTMSSLAPWPSCRSVWSLAVIQKLGREGLVHFITREWCQCLPR